MLIANPIYDSVFKYLLEDNKIAIKLLSLITGKNIKNLELLPTEFNSKLEEERHFTVYRLDFSAKVRLADGSFINIIIEIQKAKFHTDIMRFRKYLGGQYANENNTYLENDRRKARPIYSIYFLGHNLMKNQDIPVIKVERKYFDNASGNELKQKEEFIESLTHDSIIIQIPELKKRRRDLLENVLEVFGNAAPKTHLMDFDEADYPEEYREIIRRLQKAGSETELSKKMDVEDEILTELENLERMIAKRDKALEDNKKALEDNKKIIEDKDKALEDKDKALEDKDKALEDKDKALANALALLVDAGMSKENAREKLGL